MSWNSCGSVTLNNWDWKTFSIPIVGTEGAFKLKQSFNQGLIYPSGYFLFAWICSNAGIYSIRRIYFDNQVDRLFQDSLPANLISVCTVRYGIAKLPKSARVDQNNLPRIELFEFFA